MNNFTAIVQRKRNLFRSVGCSPWTHTIHNNPSSVIIQKQRNSPLRDYIRSSWLLSRWNSEI